VLVSSWLILPKILGVNTLYVHLIAQRQYVDTDSNGLSLCCKLWIGQQTFTNLVSRRVYSFYWCNMKGISASCTFCLLQACCTYWGLRKLNFRLRHVIWNFKHSLRTIFRKYLDSLDHVYYKQLLELRNEWTFGCHKRHGISRPAERIRVTQFYTPVKVFGLWRICLFAVHCATGMHSDSINGLVIQVSLRA